MSDIQREMQEIQNDQAAQQSQVAKSEEQDKAERKSVQNEIQDFLNQLAKEFLAGDDKLYLDQGFSGQIGFTIGYPLSFGWNSKKFSVSASYTQGKLEVTVGDGKWEQMSNVMGNWADWSDLKMVFCGSINKERLQRIIEQQFVAWYRSSVDFKPQ